MGRTFSIELDGLQMDAEWNDSPTAKALEDALPLEADVQTWGDEIYFAVPVKMPLDATAVEIVEMGDLGYWPTGSAFCIFFGPTPASRGEEIRPASAVNVVGKVLGDPVAFKQVRPGARIRLREKT